MAVAYAPFGEDESPQVKTPPRVVPKSPLPVSDNTECNYIVMGFVVGVFLLGLVDSMRSK